MGFENGLTISIADVMDHFEKIDPGQVEDWRAKAAQLGLELTGQITVTKDPKILGALDHSKVKVPFVKNTTNFEKAIDKPNVKLDRVSIY